MKSNRFELEVDAELKNLSVINDFVTEATKQLGVAPGHTSGIQLAVDEACTNIIKYAYAEQKDLITLTLEIVDEELIITVTDRGQPFDPESVPQPDLEADLEERSIGGLGMYLMRKLMDDVSYSFSAREGNKLTMRKHLRPPYNQLKDHQEFAFHFYKLK